MIKMKLQRKELQIQKDETSLPEIFLCFRHLKKGENNNYNIILIKMSSLLNIKRKNKFTQPNIAKEQNNTRFQIKKNFNHRQLKIPQKIELETDMSRSQRAINHNMSPRQSLRASKLFKKQMQQQQVSPNVNDEFQNQLYMQLLKIANEPNNILLNINNKSRQGSHSREISRYKSVESYIRPSPRNRQNQNIYQTPLKAKFMAVFDLYIKQQIMKHHCLKTKWRFEFQGQNSNKLVKDIILPTLDLLAVKRQNIKMMFQPFLAKITQRYLLRTEKDIYFTYSHQSLLVQLTQNWIKIKQSEIALKREIRSHLKQFKNNFCIVEQNINYKYSLMINRGKLFHYLFKNSKQLKMVNVVKLYIFLFKVFGEQQDGDFDQWLQNY